jgi:predicted small lipoprotein YifL
MLAKRILILAASLWLTACGIKGDLYLPEPEPQPVPEPSAAPGSGE